MNASQSPLGPPQSETAIANRGPLEGLVVLDFTTQKAGPVATYYLAALGATVIKIEELKGDAVRGFAPFVDPTGALTMWRTGAEANSVPMLARARGKYGVTLNLKKPEALGLYREMVKRADIVVENYATGTADRLGIGYEATRSINPRIVYCSVSGFGVGEMPGRKALDVSIQAASGLMLANGSEGEPPVRVGMSIADSIAAVYGVMGINAALYRRERTGEGSYVDISMLGTMTSFLATEEWQALETLGEPTRTGNFHLRASPFGVFQSRDGWIAIGAGSRDPMAHALFRMMGREEWVTDPRYATLAARCQHNDELCDAVAAWSRNLSSDEIQDLLASAGVPVEKVRSPSEAMDDPLLEQRKEITSLAYPGLGDLPGFKTFGLPIVFRGHEHGTASAAPGLGEHNTLIYGEWLGYGDEQLRAWKDAGVF